MSKDITPKGSACPVFLEEANADEVAAREAQIEAIEKEKTNRAKAKQAVLTKLGLTADEVAALLS